MQHAQAGIQQGAQRQHQAAAAGAQPPVKVENGKSLVSMSEINPYVNKSAVNQHQQQAQAAQQAQQAAQQRRLQQRQQQAQAQAQARQAARRSGGSSARRSCGSSNSVCSCSDMRRSATTRTSAVNRARSRRTARA